MKYQMSTKTCNYHSLITTGASCSLRLQKCLLLSFNYDIQYSKTYILYMLYFWYSNTFYKKIRDNFYLSLLRISLFWIHLQWLFQGTTEDIMNTMILGLYVCRQWKQSPRSFSQMFHESFFILHEYIFSSSTSPRHTLLWRSPFHVVIMMILCGRGHLILNS